MSHGKPGDGGNDVEPWEEPDSNPETEKCDHKYISSMWTIRSKVQLYKRKFILVIMKCTLLWFPAVDWLRLIEFKAVCSLPRTVLLSTYRNWLYVVVEQKNLYTFLFWYIYMKFFKYLLVDRHAGLENLFGHVRDIA